ncbi:MAG TPA: hypothetical protein VFG54_18650 [Prolixibacteraceae bacterium]|nr:hypothetical protein [Prolixibacteraceae bacterium]
MNDELERLILDNRHSLENEEPMEGHFERFEARLQKASKPSKVIYFKPILRIAAIVVFALLAVNHVRIYFFPEKQEALTLGSISAEYREVEFYYTNAIEDGMSQWNKLNKEGYVTEAEQQIMLEEQQEFDRMYQKLQEDLNENPNDERVINAMIEYYQARMNIINLIINKLQEVKQQKNNKSHEIKI